VPPKLHPSRFAALARVGGRGVRAIDVKVGLSNLPELWLLYSAIQSRRSRPTGTDADVVRSITGLMTLGKGLVSNGSLAASIAERVALQQRTTARHIARVRRSQRNLTLGVISRSRLSTGCSTASVVVGGNLGLDTASVGSGSDLRQDRSNRLHEAELHVRSCVIQRRLDDVVGEGVTQKPLDLLRREHLLDNHVLGRALSAAQAFLYDVGAEFVARQLAHTATEHGHNGLGEGRLIEINDVLDDVIAEGILNENPGMFGNTRDEPVLLVAGSMINAALQDTATVTVGTNFNAVVANGIKDELSIGRGELVEAFLDDMVAIQILNKLHNTEPQGLDDEMNLLRSADILNHLLQGTSAVLV
jgi:hypothetical protein